MHINSTRQTFYAPVNITQLTIALKVQLQTSKPLEKLSCNYSKRGTSIKILHIWNTQVQKAKLKTFVCLHIENSHDIVHKLNAKNFLHKYIVLNSH